MLLLLIGCIMPKDPSVSPEIEDFYFDNPTTTMENNPTENPDDPDDTADPPEPTDVESALEVSIDYDVLSVVHRNISLPCEVDFEPTLEITDFVFTVTYVEETSSDCMEDYTLEYSINVSGLEAGNYLFEAHGDSTEFVLE